MDEHDHDLDDLLRDLPDAPPSWVRAAEEIPLLMQAAEAADGTDEQSLRAALVAVGLTPDADRVRALDRIVRRRPS